MRMALTDEMEKYQINLSLYRMIQVKADNEVIRFYLAVESKLLAFYNQMYKYYVMYEHPI